MKKTKLFVLIALALVCVLFVCACNGDSGTTNPDQTTDGSTPDNTTSADGTTEADVTTGDPNCEHAYGESVVVTPALALKDGDTRKTLCMHASYNSAVMIPVNLHLRNGIIVKAVVCPNGKGVPAGLGVGDDHFKLAEAAVMAAQLFSIQPHVCLCHHSAKAEPQAAAQTEEFLFVPGCAFVTQQAQLGVPYGGDLHRLCFREGNLPVFSFAAVFRINAEIPGAV